MPATDYLGFPSSPSPSFGLSILNIGRNQVDAMVDVPACYMTAAVSTAEQQELLAFHCCVTDHFLNLFDADFDSLLSLSWLRKLLQAYLVCHEEFRALLLDRGGLIVRPPLDRLVADFSDCAVKALDICNATRDSISQLRHWQTHLEIVAAALGRAALRHKPRLGQLRRARRALTELSIMLADRDYIGGSSSPSSPPPPASGGNSLSHALSSRVSLSWSATRQRRASVGGNDEVADTTVGLAVHIYTMNSVLLLTMRSLVAAIPCPQDRGLHADFSIPRTFPWAAPIMSLHGRIVEESKKKNSTGLLKEIQQIERCTHQLAKMIDTVHLPMSEAKEKEMREMVEELARVSEALKEGLDTLECQVREIFLRMVRSRNEGLDCLSHSGR